ncbi:MAG: murein biosynthesis integral membrane protein MurJ [Beijerinckiaceae bacterium]
MSLARNFTIVGSATLASRLTGFLRDMLVAAALGATAIADAYVAAFLLPNLFRRLVGEGAFNAAFVPIFARREADGGKASAEIFAEGALSLFLGLAILILVVGQIGMPQIIGLMAPGFAMQPDKFADAVAFGRVMFPFVGVILLVAVLNGTLNALGRYAIASWAPVLLNVLLIGALSVAILAGLSGTREAGFTLVWTVLAAGFINLLIVAGGVWRAGLRIVPGPFAFDADLWRLLVIALPGIAIAGAGQINVVVAAQISSATPSAVSWLYFAERIFQLPLGFVAAAIGVVLLPTVARAMAAGDLRAARNAECRALEFGLLVTLPAAAALMLLAKPIVALLFERGAFTAVDSSAVAAMLRALAFGLPAFVLIKVFLPAFLARETIRGPLIAALGGVLVNVMAATLLAPGYGPSSAAIGVSASAFANALVLFLLLRRDQLFALDPLAQKRLPRVLLASALTALVLWLLVDLARPWLKTSQPLGLRVLALAALTGTTLTFHAAIAQATGAMDLSEMRAALRKKTG